MRLLLGPAPRFATVMLARSGELFRHQSRVASPAVEVEGQGVVAIFTNTPIHCVH